MIIASTKQPPVTDANRPTWLHTLHSNDPDEMAESQPNWSLRYEQLSCGDFNGKLTHLQLPGLQVVSESSSCALRQRGDLGRGHYGFAITLDQRNGARFNGQRLDPGSMMIGRSDDFDLSSPADLSLMGIVVERDLLASLWERMYHKRLVAWLDNQIVAKPHPANTEALRKVHFDVLGRVLATPEVLDDPFAARQMRDAILIEWIEAIPPQVATAGLKATAARKRVVDRACEVMLSQPEQPKSILEVCSLIGASPTKLAYCFRDILGVSPVKYLRAVRLNGARRDLKRCVDRRLGVQDIATRWGFWHLGDFSADFKRQFGELPSETLNSARAGNVEPNLLHE